jgi:hypothetical protein
MRRMELVPCLPSGPVASCLASADRPWRPTSSSLQDRCSQRPYYRFYYGRPRITADNRARLSALRVPVVALGVSGNTIVHPWLAWAALRLLTISPTCALPECRSSSESGGPIPRSFDLPPSRRTRHRKALGLITVPDVVLAPRGLSITLSLMAKHIADYARWSTDEQDLAPWARSGSPRSGSTSTTG